MKKRSKVIVIGILCVLAAIIGSCILLYLGFQARYWKKVRNTPRPPYLAENEILVIERAFGITFPASSTRILAYYDGDGGLYCHTEFDQTDLENFKIGRRWFSTEEGQKILARNAEPPLRRVMGALGGQAAPIEWWKLSEEHVSWLSSVTTPDDPGGHIDIVVQRSQTGKVGAYIARRASRNSLPPAILEVFPPNKIRWDLRESNKHPRRSSM